MQIIKEETISREDLSIAGMVRHPYLAKHINDASWGNFIRTLEYKAESAGVQVAGVEPKGTTQECCRCGVKVPKTLAMRWHRCPGCGIKLDRDLNAAINIKLRGIAIAGTAERKACGDGSSVPARREPEHSLSGKQEAPCESWE
jgi:IS605 OrfB family transposase